MRVPLRESPVVKPLGMMAVLCVGLLGSPAVAQKGGGGGPGGGPGGGGFTPGGGGGARPNPGGGIPNPGGNFNPGGRPNPGGGFNPGGGIKPGFPGQVNPGFQPGGGRPGVYNPAGGGFGPGAPPVPQPPTPLQFRNPLASSNSRIVPAGTAIQVSNPTLPRFGGGAAPEFQQARDFARAGRGAELTGFLNTHVQAHGNNLPQLFSAVNALHGVENPGYAQLRTTTLGLAQKQIAEGATNPTPFVVVAQMSLQDQNSQKFNEATRALAQRFPDSEYSHFFRGVQHLQNRDFKQAEEALRRSRELGMPDESVAELLRVAIDNQKWIWEYAAVVGVAVGAWLFGLVALFVVGKLLSRRTLANLHREAAGAAAGDRWQRALYRRVITLAAGYYYLSLPMVLVVSIATPLALGYALLMVPYFNIFLVVAVLVLGLGGIVTAVSGIRTAFLRVRPGDAGRAVDEEELPELWALAKGVARTVGTRPVDRIRLVWSPDVCVYEKGSARERRRDRAERVLVLGVGALYGMKADALRAVLAHEYGHFQNRDTAGGDVALRVNLAMNNFARAIAARGKVRWWDLAIHFLRLYHLIFRRLTLGASRLQEVHADRAAVEHYGAAAFREGLTHVIRRSVEFDWAVNKSVDNAIKTGVPAVALFDRSVVPEVSEREQIETAVAAILGRATDAEDSHPSPRDRFRLADRLDPMPLAVADDDAWTLVVTNTDLVAEMKQSIEEAIRLESEVIAGHINAGIRALSRSLRQQFDPNVLFERGRLYLSLGSYDEAIKDFGELLEVVPGQRLVRYLLGTAFRRNWQHARAIAEFRALVAASDPGARASLFDADAAGADERFLYLVALAQCLEQIDDHRGAYEAYDEALRLNESSMVARVGRANTAAALGDDKPARDDVAAAPTA